jgi:hypothetical protein
MTYLQDDLNKYLVPWGFGHRFVSGYCSEGEHKVRPYIAFAHRLDFGLTCNFGYTLMISCFKSYGSFSMFEYNQANLPQVHPQILHIHQ